ncbi:MAG: formylglycine-generating enzyme family protein [bacterium]
MSDQKTRLVGIGITLLLVLIVAVMGHYLGGLIDIKPEPVKQTVIPAPASSHSQTDEIPSKVKSISGMVYISAGGFLMGTNRELERPLKDSFGFKFPPYSDEEPRHRELVKDYYIDKYEVTIGDYVAFCKKTGRMIPDYLKGVDLKYWRYHPVSHVSFSDAKSYAEFIHKRLPTEAEWERSARGTIGRRYVWGDKFDAQKANIWQKGTLPVGWVSADKSVYGVYDLMGNVAEWTSSLYKPYPGNKLPGDYEGEKRVIKGGSWGGRAIITFPIMCGPVTGAMPSRTRSSKRWVFAALCRPRILM